MNTKILIVDDDTNICELLRLYIEKEGYSTVIANDPEIGSIYRGKVTRLMTFGAFVEIAPGKEGLVHISKLDVKRTEKVEDVVAVGDEIIVKVTEIDDQGRINLSRRDALVEIEGAVVEDDGAEEERKPRRPRQGFRNKK